MLMADGEAVLYRQQEHVFGCVPGLRSYDLGPLRTGSALFAPGAAGAPTLAGSMVAFEESVAGPMVPTIEPAPGWIVVRDLRTGRFVTRAPRLGLGPHALQIVVKSDGAVAWTIQLTEGLTGNPIQYEVRAVDASGDRSVAVGTNFGTSLGYIDPMSLALAGSTLYWTEGGAPRSAALH